MMTDVRACDYCGVEQDAMGFPVMKKTHTGKDICFDHVKCNERFAKRLKGSREQ